MHPEPPKSSRSRGRAAWAAVRRALGSSPAAGAAALLAFFVAELALAPRVGLMGVHDDAIAGQVLARHARFILVEQLAIAAAYALIGAVFGFVAGFALRGWEALRPADRPAPRRRRRFLVVAALVLAAHAVRLAATVIRYPQLFVETLYAHGGVRRSLQLLLTDDVPLTLLEALFALAVTALVVGPLATARGRHLAAAAVRRAAARARARRRDRLTAASVAGAAAALVLLAIAIAVGPLTPSHARATAPATPSPSAATTTALPGASPPNLLILAVDSLRADRVGPGHERVAPHLAALAARSVRFDGAHVSLPRTFPSWMTLLTGRWPAHHGVRTMFPSAAERRAVGPALPSLLAARGYDTVVVSDFAGEIFSRVDVGFRDRRVPYFDLRTVVAQVGINLHPSLFPYVATALGHRVATSLETAADNADPERLADRVIDALHDHRKRPFLLTAFFSTAHFPYAAPDPYYRRFTDPRYDGPFRYHKPPPGPGEPDPAIRPEDVVQVRALYDGAVAATDAALARVLDALAREGLADRTIVVVLADHGENLYEPGRGMGHGEHLLGDNALHIPLLLLDPVHRFPPHAVPGLVRDVDLAPTLAALVGARFEGGDGVDLAPLLRGERPSLGLDAFAETGLWFTEAGPGFEADERLPYPAIPASVTLEDGDDIVLRPELREMVVVAKHRALRTERWKLRYAPTRDGARFALFDLPVDPDERRDVSSQHPDVVRDLAGRLLDWSSLGAETRVGDFVVPR